MRYSAIANSLFIENRQRLQSLLKPNALVILNSNDIMPTNGDGSMGFRQNSDLFYLTGVDQEESIMILAPNHPDHRFREVLFVRETNDLIAVWEGEKLSKEQAKSVSGINSVYWTHQFNTILSQIVYESEYVYLNTNEHTRHDSMVQTREARFIIDFKNNYPIHQLVRLAPLLHQLRAVKQEQEVALIQKACNITKSGFERILPFIKPGIYEYEIEAELIHEFIRNRSKGFAYQPIIASGANACVLHYIQNNCVCKDGDLILLDVAAEYANYASDLTRTVPVNGRFSKRQKEVYTAVLNVLKETQKLLVAGNLMDEYQAEVGKIMERELINLGLITKQDIENQNPEAPAYKKYFPHGNSHFLGLDVHDVGSRYRRFEAGNVLTCEPGIYIREEGIGIRLENNILITENGNINLMGDIPIEIEEIESLMNQ